MTQKQKNSIMKAAFEDRKSAAITEMLGDMGGVDPSNALKKIKEYKWHCILFFIESKFESLIGTLRKGFKRKIKFFLKTKQEVQQQNFQANRPNF